MVVAQELRADSVLGDGRSQHEHGRALVEAADAKATRRRRDACCRGAERREPLRRLVLALIVTQP